jgi:D-3-phosphoglycerate dehydrogenase
MSLVSTSTVPSRIQIFNKISHSGLSILDPAFFQTGTKVDDPDAILLRSHNLHEFVMGASLKAIGRAGAGVNNIPVDKCSDCGVVVFNTPGANANAVKELVVLSMLISSRNILDGVSYLDTIKQSGDLIPSLVESNKSQFKGVEISGKRLAVIGLGAIGVMVANTASSLGMHVSGYDPFITVNRAWGLSRSVVQAQNLNTLLADSDYVTLHMPLNKQTKNFFDKDHISRLHPKSILLNFSRPEIVNEHEVVSALGNNKFFKYVCDFPTESFISNPNVIVLPHLGASTLEAEDNCSKMIVSQVSDFLSTGNITNSVNLPNCSMDFSGSFRLSIINRNVPNMVGKISQLIANFNLNISEMINKSQDSLAYTLVDVVGPFTDQLLTDLLNIEGVIKARLIYPS